MHSDTFALHVGKEALQQGGSTARKFRASSKLIEAEKRLRWFHARWIGTNGVRRRRIAVARSRSTSVVIRSRRGRPKLP
jgi:hypothetical protein